MPRLKKRILVVTANAGAARLFECARIGGPLLQVGEMSAQAPPTARDRPFRAHDRFGTGRHAIEARRSPRLAAEERFLSEVAEAVAERTFDALVLCAPAKALGFLRQHLPDRLRERIVLTSPRDYLRETLTGLAARLNELALAAKEEVKR